MTSFVDTFRPAQKGLALFFDLLALLTGSAVLALTAQFSVPLLPVPISLQTLGLFLVIGALGKKRGTLAVMAYLAEGALGLPVFAGGAFGFAALIGPTAGYLLAFVPAAYLVGYFLEKGWRERFGLTFVAMSVASVVILALGAAWLSLFIGVKGALLSGVFPFLIGDLIKSIVAAGLVSSGTRWMRSST